MRAFTLISLLLLSASPTLAQGPAPVGLRAASVMPNRGRALSVPNAGRETQWKKGALIGGATGLAATIIGRAAVDGCLLDAPCNRSILLALLPMAVLALIGGLIGSTVSKP